MSRVYTVSFSNVTVSAQQDFFSIKAADDKPFCIHEVVLGVAGVAADAGDAQEELLGVEICRGNSTIGSGGSNPTAVPVNSADAAFGPTTNVRANDTTKVSAGTRTLLYADAFNSRVGWRYQPAPEDRLWFKEGDNFMAVQLMSTPTDGIAMHGTIVVEEL